jgi:parvulin-like peptidyl-prolyl isomerase
VARKKIEKLQKEYSKPQLTKWQRQKKTQFWTLIIGVAVIIIVLALIGTGFYINTWRPAHETMLVVNGKKFDTTDFANLLRALSTRDPNSIENYANNNVIPSLKEAEEARQAAAKVGISVSDSEVKDYMSTNKITSGFEPVVREVLLEQKLVKDYFSKQVEKTAEQRDVQAMLLESASQADEIRGQLNDSNFSDFAAANSVDPFTKDKKGEVGEHPQPLLTSLFGDSPVVSDTAFALQEGQLSQSVADAGVQKSEGYWLIMPIEVGTGNNAGKVNLRAMLLGSYEEALQIKSILDEINDPALQAGKFTDIAKAKTEYQYAPNGLLGMTAKGMLGSAFDAVAFNLGVGEISNPVKDASQTTRGGYWLVKVTKIDQGKELSSDDINALAQQKFNDWFKQVQTDYGGKVKDLSNPKNIAWAVNKAKEGLPVNE